MVNVLGQPAHPSGLCLANVEQYCGPPVSAILRIASLKSYSGWFFDMLRTAFSTSVQTFAIDNAPRHRS